MVVHPDIIQTIKRPTWHTCECKNIMLVELTVKWDAKMPTKIKNTIYMVFFLQEIENEIKWAGERSLLRNKKIFHVYTSWRCQSGESWSTTLWIIGKNIYKNLNTGIEKSLCCSWWRAVQSWKQYRRQKQYAGEQWYNLLTHFPETFLHGYVFSWVRFL